MSSNNRRPDTPNDAQTIARNLLISASFVFAVFMSHSAAAVLLGAPQLLNGQIDCASLPDCWEEQGLDAGDYTDPQLTYGGVPSQRKLFHGDVGGPINGAFDYDDAFTFLLVDGNGQSSFDIAVGFDSFFTVTLWDGDLDLPPAPIFPTGELPPDDAFPLEPGLFNMAYRFNGLPPGDYIVQISSQIDPPFTLGVGLIPGQSGGGIAFGSVPEPTTLALMGIGLAGLVFTRRRKNSV